MKFTRSRRTTKIASLFLTIGELIEGVPEEPPWIWNGYITPGSLTLLAGKAKVGKSTLVYGLLGALERGESFVGRTTRKTTAVILSEEPEDTIAEKARRFGGGSHKIITRAKARRLTWPQLVEYAASHALDEGHGLIVVDTLAELAGLRGDDENDAGAMIAAIDPLRDAAVRGLALLIVAHQRKSGGTHGEGVRGSNALIAAVNVVAELERQGSSETKRLIKGTSHYQSTPPVLAVELTADGYVARDGSRANDGLTRVEATLIDLGEGVSAGRLAEVTGLPRTTLDTRLKTLVEMGRVVTRGAGTKSNPVLYEVAA